MASPSPAPPPGVRAGSPRKPASKIRGSTSSGTPPPPSATETKASAPRRPTSTMTEPSAGVWRTAFSRMFRRARGELRGGAGEVGVGVADPSFEADALRCRDRPQPGDGVGHQVGQ